VAIDDAMTVLRKRWDALLAEVDDATRTRLRALNVELSAAASDKERARIRRSIIEVSIARLAESSQTLSELNDALTGPRLVSGKIRRPHPTGHVTAVKPPVDTWILEAPAVSERNLRRRGGDPDLPGLIRLARLDGRVSLPSFQFTRAGDPKPLVLQINKLLGADTDPWGVADWWLCPNVWLAGTPADLLDTVDDHVLVAAAAVVVEG
jgi:hypothetical protein